MAGSTSTAQQLVATVPDHLREHLSSARELARRHEENLRIRPTGVEPLDRVLGGGAPRGQLIEIIGRRGSGRFSLVLATLAAITACGDTAALIDLGDTLDPQNAATLGVDLERLLWIRPRHMKPALHATESVVAAGFPLVLLDLGIPPVPGGRGIEAAWLRLARAAARQESVLLVASPYRVSGTAATAVIRAQNVQPRWSGKGPSPRLLEGLNTHIRLAKTRLHQHHSGVSEIASYALSSTANPLAQHFDGQRA